MVYYENYYRLCLCLCLCLCYSTVTLTLHLEGEDDDGSANGLKNQTVRKPSDIEKQPHSQEIENLNKLNTNNTKNDNVVKNNTDLNMAATDYKPPQLHLPVVIKPRGFHLPKNRPAHPKQNDPQQPAAQNYYNNFFPEFSHLEHAQPYYSLTEDPIINKFLSQHHKQYQPQPRSLTAYDASILGSGDFGILKGGTFYSGEEQSYINEEGSEFYYGDASNTHPVSSTEGFIQKYTYPEEQFAQFRDFADLGTPTDSAFSQYVVVYAAKNSTRTAHQNSKPKNIFEQLQAIDQEKAQEHKKLRKNQTNPKITKLKLVRTKLMEKKWVQRQPVKVTDDDPLIALS